MVIITHRGRCVQNGCVHKSDRFDQTYPSPLHSGHNYHLYTTPIYMSPMPWLITICLELSINSHESRYINTYLSLNYTCPSCIGADKMQTGLLQLSAVRCSSQQHSGCAATAKQCSQDRSPSSKTISWPAITA